MGLYMKSDGNILVADRYNNAIRLMATNAAISTLLGGTLGSADGVGTYAQLFYPQGLCVDTGGNIYITEPNRHSIRKVTTNLMVTMFAGMFGRPFFFIL
jgi:hypothetical protein